MGHRARIVVKTDGGHEKLVAYTNGKEAAVKRQGKWETFTDKPVGAYIPPDSSPLYQRLLYTGGHLYLKAYWPKYARLRAKIKEARERAKIKSYDSEIPKGG